MARKLFERQAIRRRTGALAPGVVMVVYTDAAGTVPADISATSGGSAIPGSTVTTANIAGFGPAALQFWGPPDGTDTLYIKVPSDTSLGVQEIEAATDPRLDALESGSATGIPGSIFDAKGDIIAASAADTAARLAVGANDTVLTADSTTGTGLKWATSSGGVSLAGTNTWTGVNTWTNASLFKSGRPWVDVRAYGTNTAAIDAAWAAAQAAGAALYFSPGGDYTYGGTGLDGGTITCIGAGRDLVTITLSAGVYLFKPTGVLGQTLIQGITTSGGKGLLQHTYTSANVTRHHTISLCRFTGYTECAISNESSDMPYWRIYDNIFEAANDETTIGVALANDPSGSLLLGNSFLRNRIDIKSRHGGLSVSIVNCDFIHFDASPSQIRARVWFVPHTSAVNGGTGAIVRDCKFGNENLEATDLDILYADEGSGATNSVKMPALGADSTGYIVTHTYSGNKVSGTSGRGPFVYSTTPHVVGCTIGPNTMDGTPPSYLLQFRTPPGPDRAVATNRLGPILNSDMGVEQRATPASNAAWLGAVVDPNAQLDVMAGKGHQPIPGGGDPVGYVNLLTTGIRSFQNPFTFTLTDVTDAVGGTNATEITYTSGYVYAYVTTIPVTGSPAFLEFDLKAGSSSPLASVEAWVGYDGGSGPFHVKRIPAPPASGWAKYRVPLKFATATGSVLVQFVSAAAGKIQIGRVRLYQASEPLNIDGALPAGGYAVSSIGGGKEGLQGHGNTGTTETIDLGGGNIHTATLDNNCTFTFTGATAGRACSFTLLLVQDATGSRTVTWPASVDWPIAAAPTLSTGAGKVDMLTFLTVDGGTTWLGNLVSLDYR